MASQSSYVASLLKLLVLPGLYLAFAKVINSEVPYPYLDEIFHIPQAQTYLAGLWSQWDPKITTPPALYVWTCLWLRGGRTALNVPIEQIRRSNSVLLFFLSLAVWQWQNITRRDGSANRELKSVYLIPFFPLLFFFSALYYTDILAALTVVLTCLVWERSRKHQRGRRVWQLLHVLVGLVSLASRQTNVFWVAVYLGGLQVVDTVRFARHWTYDPVVSEAYVEDYIYLCFCLVQNVFSLFTRVLLDLVPHLTILASFAAFVVWNGGVVLGDKSNHVATIHTPQLLYIWPFMVFFSWPLMLPQLTSLSTLRQRLPRPSMAILVMLLMLASVHYNTIVHPFTLADNRHYVFYVFRILMRHWAIKYAAVPVYFFCAWLTIMSFAPVRPARVNTNTNTKINKPTTSKVSSNDSETSPVTTNNISFVLIWMIATTLSLVTAPLVEPRYFLIPWLIWRMHIIEPSSPLPPLRSHSSPVTSNPNTKSTSNQGVKSKPDSTSSLFHITEQYALWIELCWYAVINFVTVYVFLKWTFEWPGEPGVTQRFMW